MKNTISLNRNEQFIKVYRKGKRSYHKYFILHYLPNSLGCNRLGIKTGKKIAKAVYRNRVRRLLKESYRLIEPEMARGYDYILAAREGCLTADSLSEVMTAVRGLFDRAHLLQANRKAEEKS